MTVYKYKGYDGAGRKVEGEMAGASMDEVERKVAAQAVSIVAIFPAGKGGKVSRETSSSSSNPNQGFNPFRKKIPEADIGTVLRDLAVMAETGVPFVEALDATIATARTPQLQTGLKRLRDEIVGGKGLAAGLRASGIFPVIVSEMVKVAEEGGRLDKALSSAANYVERSADLRKKVMNAMLYPIVLTVIAFSTIIVMITFVLPRFANIFKTMKADIPASTQMMLAAGDWTRSNPLIAVGVVVGLVVGTRVLWAIPSVNRFLFTVFLKVPVLGELLRRLALSRSLQSISTLLSTNVNLMMALDHAAKVAGNPVIHDAFLQARSSVEHGATLADSMAKTRAFPPSLVQMVMVGERTGRLQLLMKNTAAHMEEDVDGRLKALVSIVEPVMIVVMGTIVGGITMSIIIPMYSIVEKVR